MFDLGVVDVRVAGVEGAKRSALLLSFHDILYELIKARRSLDTLLVETQVVYAKRTLKSKR